MAFAIASHPPSAALMNNPPLDEPSHSRRRQGIEIVVDHGEAYGNLGEEAMILNALRRLDLHLQPSAMHLVHQPGEPLPHGDNPKVQSVPSPLPSFRAAADRLRRRLRRIPGFKRQDDLFYWRLLAKIDRLWPRMSGLGSDVHIQQFFHALEQSDVYFHVGMSGLNDCWEAGLVYKRWVLEQARRRGLLVILSAQGLGPVCSPSSRTEMKALLQLADVVTLRDRNYGTALLRDLGVKQAGGKIVFDEAFSFAAADKVTTKEWLESAGVTEGEAFIAFHYREKNYTGDHQDPTARLGGLLEQIHRETQLKILFVPMSYAAHSCVDSLMGKRISACIGNPAWFRVLPECRDPGIVKSVVGQARFSIGLSYHIHVFSLSQGHPALILFTGRYYELKSNGLVDFYGPPSRAMDLTTASDSEIVKAVLDIEQNRAETCRQIAAINQRLAEVNDWVFDEIRRRLEDGSKAGNA